MLIHLLHEDQELLVTTVVTPLGVLADSHSNPTASMSATGG
jgi:hypothetical protein